MDWRRVASVGGVVLALAAAAPAMAADVSTYSVDGSGSGSSRSCRAQISPSDNYGDSNLKLAIASSNTRSTSSLRFGVDGADNYSSLTLLVDNVRSSIGGMVDTTVGQFNRSALLSALRSKKPIFVTGLKRDGSYASSRFEGLDVEGMIAQLAQRCPFEAEALSPSLTAAAQRAENSLYMPAPDMLRVRWVLARRGNFSSEPDPSSGLNDADRTQLLAYELSKGLPISRYLNRAVASSLASESFHPLPPDLKSTNVAYHEDWRSYSYDSGGKTYCGIASVATSVDTDWIWQTPAMMYEAEKGITGNTLNLISLSYPSPFDPKQAIWANVDGRRYSLELRYDYWLWPPEDSNGLLDSSVIGAIKRGREVSVSGTNKATGSNMTLYYSGHGFTSAFGKMASDCRRPKIMDWVK